jgi:hypothetical protein
MAGGESESPGHVSVQVARRPALIWNLTLGDLQAALKALSHCPRLRGSLPGPVRKNIGFGLTVLRKEIFVFREQKIIRIHDLPTRNSNEWLVLTDLW